MKVHVVIIDKKAGVYQQGMVDEPVVKGKEIENALKHFGAFYGEINWIFDQNNQIKYGEIIGTTKIVSIITI